MGSMGSTVSPTSSSVSGDIAPPGVATIGERPPAYWSLAAVRSRRRTRAWTAIFLRTSYAPSLLSVGGRLLEWRLKRELQSGNRMDDAGEVQGTCTRHLLS